MSGAELPELWRNRERYSVEEAVRLWAFALAGVPLEQPVKVAERKDYRRENAAAEQDLRKNVPLQTEDHMVDVQKPADPHHSSFVSGGWDSMRSGPRTYAMKERRTREFFLGSDLAAYAKKRDRAGLFGFEEAREPAESGSSVSAKEEPKVLEILAAILVKAYGGDILKDLTKERSTMFGRVLSDVNRIHKVSESTLRKYLKRLPE